MDSEISEYWFHPLFMDSEISDYCYAFVMLLLVKSACILIDFCDNFAIILRPEMFHNCAYSVLPFDYLCHTSGAVFLPQKQHRNSTFCSAFAVPLQYGKALILLYIYCTFIVHFLYSKKGKIWSEPRPGADKRTNGQTFL